MQLLTPPPPPFPYFYVSLLWQNFYCLVSVIFNFFPSYFCFPRFPAQSYKIIHKSTRWVVPYDCFHLGKVVTLDCRWCGVTEAGPVQRVGADSFNLSIISACLTLHTCSKLRSFETCSEPWFPKILNKRQPFLKFWYGQVV